MRWAESRRFEPASLPISFRPANSLLCLGALTGLLCALGAVAAVLSSGPTGPKLTVGALMAGPVILAIGLFRRAICVSAEGLTACGLLRANRVNWQEVLAIEQTRRSFVIITERGDISAGWIDEKRRDLLFRKVLELARLTLDQSEPRWGIRARFVRGASRNIIRRDDVHTLSIPEQHK